jgi:hypothetical protein
VRLSSYEVGLTEPHYCNLTSYSIYGMNNNT